MFTVRCPECKAERQLKRAPDLPRNHETGIYLRFCRKCMREVYYVMVRSNRTGRKKRPKVRKHWREW